MLQAKVQTRAASIYEDMPFWSVLFRYLWPFWLFQDASRGDKLARAAAYRHNRSMRIYLPNYLAKWTFNSALALASTAGCETLAAHSNIHMPFNLLAAAMGIAFALSLCVTFVIGYIYLHLDRHE